MGASAYKVVFAKPKTTYVEIQQTVSTIPPQNGNNKGCQTAPFAQVCTIHLSLTSLGLCFYVHVT